MITVLGARHSRHGLRQIDWREIAAKADPSWAREQGWNSQAASAAASATPARRSTGPTAVAAA